ncbi:MAG: aspartate--ammonia ligase [Clostridia bacterium]|nr:aspartate--ammonia ligase [Clostridia bacterium]
MQYEPTLSLLDTEIAIKYIKDTFERELAKALKLTRVSAPLFVQPETGLNDNLNGYERAVRFDVLSLGKEVEIVQSLAKWKRMALAKYGFSENTGLYTDMNAIRRDEDLDAIHSVYVDQWDWEKIIRKEDRKLSYLKKTVKSIYKAILKVSKAVNTKYPQLKHDLPSEITFVSTKRLEAEYPNLTRKQRETEIAKKYGAVFVYQIGWPLSDGKPHDGRAADYDDWKLNGDVLLWYDVLGIALEVSSMGIRVDEKSLVKQLKKKKELSKLDNPYCKSILDGSLPLTIGGGIGQSRLCMFFLNKAHIGEVQSSVWSDECIKENEKKGIHLL